MGYFELLQKNIKKRVLQSIHFEITQNCNFQCAHCFQVKKNHGNCLTLKDITNLINDASKLGCLHITFTGGEPFTRPDLFDILNETRKLTYSFSIMSNASLITNKIIKQLKQLNVTNLEISLLGITEKTYFSVTGIPNQFSTVKKNIEKLLYENFNIILKTPVLQKNINELDKIIKFTQKNKCAQMISAFIMPGNLNELSPCSERLKDYHLKKYYNIMLKHKFLNKNKLGSLTCAIGKSSLYICSNGDVYLCANLPVIIGNIKNKSIDGIWKEHISYEKYCISTKDLKECTTCNFKEYCTRCSGLVFKESGVISGKSEEACRHARILFELFNRNEYNFKDKNKKKS